VRPAPPDPSLLEFARTLRDDFARLIMEHQFAVDEVLTKVSILRREFLHLHHYNPIEHVNSRVKTPESIMAKVARKGVEPTVAAVREEITDIGGVRITCSFIADTYRILETLTSQDDLTVLSVKDYIASPKPNGYKSLHAIVEVPVFLSDGPVPVKVEVQIRTIAMDFWASLEHKIHYKYDGEIPAEHVESLTEAAAVAEQLDIRMERLHTAVHGANADRGAARPTIGSIDEDLLIRLWRLSGGQEDGPP
jgi:putative GTP pyrophosphokinase